MKLVGICQYGNKRGCLSGCNLRRVSHSCDTHANNLRKASSFKFCVSKDQYCQGLFVLTAYLLSSLGGLFDTGAGRIVLRVTHAYVREHMT